MENTKRKGLLVVSFGTSVNETREKTIDAIETDLKNAFPEYALYRAWTSGMIIRKLKKRDKIQIDTVSEAMERMLADGIRQVVVQPTHVINGIENDQMIADVRMYEDRLEDLRFGTPLLTSEEDSAAVIEAVMEEFSDLKKEEALVFMGHGTTHYANSIYAALDYKFKDMGYENVFLGTVEAYPSMETLMKLVRAHGAKQVTLAPFMVVAGDHANNDMAGDEEGSWKKAFEDAGYEVECIVEGLGGLEEIQQIFVDHAKVAAESLAQ